jgi:hypothetical protein
VVEGSYAGWLGPHKRPVNLAAGATPVWLLGSFAVLSLLYRADTSAEQAPASAETQQPGAEVLTKRAQAERVYAELSADGAPVSAGQLAAAAGLSASYAHDLAPGSTPNRHPPSSTTAAVP